MPRKTKTPSQRAPDHLSATARSWWDELTVEYQIDDPAGVMLLTVACEALDRMLACRDAIKTDGLQVRDRFGGKRSHPLLAAERDARGQFYAGLKALNLDLEPLRDRVGRPSGV